MNSIYSDVIFTVKKEKISAHRNILAMRSSYFRALLYGGLSETTKHDIDLKVPLEAFKALLKYMYTGCMSLDQMKEEDVLDSLDLAHQYELTALELAISLYLTKNVSQKNCCKMLNIAQLYNIGTLSDVCLTLMDRNATELLTSSNFKSLSQDSLCALLERDSFLTPEVEIFKAVNEWYKDNPNANIKVV